MSIPSIYVLSRSMKNIRVFLSENFQFLEVKFSIYLNGRVFVMDSRSMLLLLCPGSLFLCLDTRTFKFR